MKTIYFSNSKNRLTLCGFNTWEYDFSYNGQKTWKFSNTWTDDLYVLREKDVNKQNYWQIYE